MRTHLHGEAFDFSRPLGRECMQIELLLPRPVSPCCAVAESSAAVEERDGESVHLSDDRSGKFGCPPLCNAPLSAQMSSWNIVHNQRSAGAEPRRLSPFMIDALTNTANVWTGNIREESTTARSVSTYPG